ncbi:MAG: hypothetical protein AABX97_09450, partial [Candidatus Thermoplasmatota archaeon]
MADILAPGTKAPDFEAVDQDGNPLAGARVSAGPTENAWNETDVNGIYIIMLPLRTFDVTAGKANYQAQTK